MLSEAQETRLKEIILGKFPDQMKLPFTLWGSTAIQSLIADLWGIYIGQRTISAYIQRRGYTPRKAAKRAYEHSDKVNQEWLDQTYPFIKKRSEIFGGEIFFFGKGG